MKKTQQSIDFKWFRDNIKELFKNYGYSYVVIKNKRVLGSYNTMIEGFNEMIKNGEKLGTFIIQRCAPNNEENILQVASMNFRQVGATC